ncbi:MAG: RsmD family RNA methyltransferase [Treponema sp.]|jgi:16S rRNA (guanine(966)-N(2))-methyltransferase RsmD|nr:RsmD family RNA methyltransferase [Treponema sp.]
MRISGGRLGGRTVRVPPGIIRPSMDRMRESVFAALGDLSSSSFLDLFSGSGIIALEAASRGACPVEAVESDRKKRGILLANASIAPERINCRFMTVELYVRRARRSFDRIFCDPPFSYRYKTELLRAIASSPLMSASTLLLIHRPRAEQISPRSGDTLVLRETRLYGASAVDFLRRKTNYDGEENT